MTLQVKDVQGRVKYCYPVHIMAIYTPLEVPWKWFKQFRGGGLWHWLQWWYGVQVSVNEWETYEHYDLEAKGECHSWRNEEFHYNHGE